MSLSFHWLVRGRQHFQSLKGGRRPFGREPPPQFSLMHMFLNIATFLHRWVVLLFFFRHSFNTILCGVIFIIISIITSSRRKSAYPVGQRFFVEKSNESHIVSSSYHYMTIIVENNSSKKKKTQFPRLFPIFFYNYCFLLQLLSEACQ